MLLGTNVECSRSGVTGGFSGKASGWGGHELTSTNRRLITGRVTENTCLKLAALSFRGHREMTFMCC